MIPARLAPTRLEAATPAGTTTGTITGHLDAGAPDFVYLPLDVPPGVREIAVAYGYDRPPGNSCDIGIFDERGIEPGGAGFRGWSGGARTEFAISAQEATPGYLPGPVNPGRWHVVLGPYQVAPQGVSFEVRVTLTFGDAAAPTVPRYPPQHLAGRPRGWYRGDCHLHTVHSDGERRPDEVAAAARAAGLDFIVTTDHNTPSSHGTWSPLAGDDLLVVTGEEVTTRNGHWLALGVPPGEWVDWRYRARDGEFARFAEQVRAGGGAVVPAHPYCPDLGCAWKFGYAEADAVEVWNGTWTLDDEAALATWDNMLTAAGPRWLPAMGNSDAHRAPQAIGHPHNVVHAGGLSRDALVDAIRAGRSWLAESSSVDLEFSATGGGGRAGIGEQLPADPGSRVEVNLTVRGVPGGVVRILSDEGQVILATLPASGAGTVTYRTTPAVAAYVRAEVRHAGPAGGYLPFGPMAALTNPIFLGRGRFTPRAGAGS